MTQSVIHCGNCQTELPGDAIFCFACGSQVSGQLECRSCRGRNPAGSQFCVQCGQVLPAPGTVEADPLADLRGDLKLASGKLDLAADQNRLNARELDLYTAEKLAAKQAQSQQKVDAARLDIESDSEVAHIQRETRHRASLDESQRQAETERQREQFQTERQDRQQSREHQQKLDRWQRKQAELDSELVFKRQAIEALREIDESQRASRVRKLEQEHTAKVAQARRDLDAEIELKSTEQTARIARTETEFDHALKLKTAEQQAKREQQREERADDLSHDRSRADLQHDEDARALELAMGAQKQLLDWKLQSKDADTRREVDSLKGKQEVQTAADRAKHQMELERLGKLNELSPETLIAATPVEQARLLAELRQTEALKGLSEEQILARAAERSPEVAQAIAEKYKSAGSQAAKEDMKELYERMFTAQSSQSQQHLSSMQKLMETALQTQRDTSVATAGGGRSATPSLPAMAINHCTTCGQPLPSQARFCGKCGSAQA
jgi:hypothetical protein